MNFLQIDSSAGSCSPVREKGFRLPFHSFRSYSTDRLYWLLIVPLFSLSIKNIFPYSLFIVVWFNITRRRSSERQVLLFCLCSLLITLQTDLPLFVSPSVSSPLMQYQRFRHLFSCQLQALGSSQAAHVAAVQCHSS